MAFDRILIPTDFSDCAAVAAEQAGRLARAWRSDVLLLHVDTSVTMPPPDSADAWKVYQAERATAIETKLAAEASALSSKHDCRVESRVVRGGPVSSILEVEADWKADFIAIGSRGHGGDRFLIGSVSIGVAREARCPVLVVRADMAERLPSSGAFARPLAAIDFSRFSDEVGRVASAVGARDATVDLVHVWHQVADGYHDISPGLEHPEFSLAVDKLVERERERLRRFAEREHLSHVEADALVERGSVAEVLVQRAEARHNDVLVLGAHGREDERALFVGSVADRALRHSEVPVLLLSDACVTALHAREAAAP